MAKFEAPFSLEEYRELKVSEKFGPHWVDVGLLRTSSMGSTLSQFPDGAPDGFIQALEARAERRRLRAMGQVPLWDGQP